MLTHQMMPKCFISKLLFFTQNKLIFFVFFSNYDEMGIFLFSRVLSSRKNKFNFSNWWGKWEELGLWNSALTSVGKVNAQSVLGWIFFILKST